jgi:hypothetical protein
MDLSKCTIEELEQRINEGGKDTIDCIRAAERLIREDAARAGGPDGFATALFVLWRQGKIAICTDSDGNLGYYKPNVQ